MNFKTTKLLLFVVVLINTSSSSPEQEKNGTSAPNIKKITTSEPMIKESTTSISPERSENTEPIIEKSTTASPGNPENTTDFHPEFLRPYAFGKIKHELDKIKLPPRFDARVKWPFCKSLNTVLDVGDCGSLSWALTPITIMSDRLCIATNGTFNGYLSTQDLVECCGKNCYKFNACRKGSSQEAFNFWTEHGLVTQECKPKITKKTEDYGQMSLQECETKCTNNSYNVSYEKDKKYGFRELTLDLETKTDNEKHMQAEIMLNGPIAAVVREDTTFESPGAYQILKTDGFSSTGRAVIRILGWDVTDDGEQVWIVSHVKGPEWCNKGYCFIRRGMNDFDVESTSAVVTATVTDGEKYQPKADQTENTNKGQEIFSGDFLKFAILLIWLLVR